MKKLFWIAVIIAAAWFISNRLGFDFSSFMNNSVTKPAPAPAPAPTPTPARTTTPAPAANRPTTPPAATTAPVTTPASVQVESEKVEAEVEGKRSGAARSDLPGGVNMQRLTETFQSSREN